MVCKNPHSLATELALLLKKTRGIVSPSHLTLTKNLPSESFPMSQLFAWVVLWPPQAKCWLVGKDWCWEGLGAGGEGDDRGWHRCLDGRESEWTPGVGDGQGGLVCCNSWGCKESDTTERLNWTELNPWCNFKWNSYKDLRTVENIFN